MAHTNKDENNLAWMDGLTQGFLKEVEEVPPGWLNARQIGDKINRSRQTAARLARAGVEEGRLIMRKFRVKSGQRVLPIPHYKETDK